MKIAVWNNLSSGGGKRALYNHVKGLIENGHEVISFCPDTADVNFMPLSNLVEEHILPLKNDLEKRTKWLRNLYPHIHQRTKAMLRHCRDCAEMINKQNFDILFANSSRDFYMSHIGRFVKIPKLIYLGEPCRYLYEAKPEFFWKAPSNDLNTFEYAFKRAKHLIQMFWYSYQCREEYTSAKSYDLILVNSFFSRESIKRAFNLDSKVCYLGIDTDLFKSYLGQEKGNYVIGVGYIQPSKGIEIAIDSIAHVELKYRPPMIWIGNTDENDEYIGYINDYAKLKNVNLVIKTHLSDEELFTLLARARVFLYLSNLEPFGLAPLEANACGTAVITIAEGGPRESVKNEINGYLVNDLSYMMIADRITAFFKNYTLSQEMGKKARDYVVNNWGFKFGINNLEYWLNFLLQQKSKCS